VNPAAQNGLMTAGYAIIFFAALDNKAIRGNLRFLIIGSAFAALYNLGYDWSIQHRLIASLALLFRVLPPLEAIWRVEHRKYYNVAFGCLIASAVVAAFRIEPSYMSIRNVASVSIALVSWGVWVLNLRRPVEILFSRNLLLQAAGMTLHAVFSVGARWYLDPRVATQVQWDRRNVARWTYVLLSLVIVIAYQHLFSYPQAQEEAQTEEECQP
jgi:hypothetical protein